MFTGGTVNLAAAHKWQHCGAFCPFMFGFDTFKGQCAAHKRKPKPACIRAMPLPVQDCPRPGRGWNTMGLRLIGRLARLI